MDANFATSPRPDWTVLLPAACVACGWFLMASLITDFGFMQLRFRFYNVLTLLHSPGSIATGTSGGQATFEAFVFGTVCAAAVVAALAPVVSTRKVAWLGCVAPFVLMALCGAILYHAISQDFIADDGSYGDTGSHLIHFANALVGKVGNVVARRIHVGAGGYLSLVASCFLAVKGLRGYRETP
jgi:hypothetical protein